MFIYGLDLGFGNTGVAIFNEEGDLVYKTSISTAVTKKTGIALNPNHKDKNMIIGIRLNHLYTQLKKLKKEYPPKIVCIERGFTRFNKATQAIFRVHGVVNLLFHDVPNIYITPKEVKNAILSGNATKEEIEEELMNIFNVTFKDNDESDAVAVGLTYIKNKKKNL